MRVQLSIAGIQGFESYIDENGDAEGNYTVLARQPFVSDFGNYSLLPIGHFEIGQSKGTVLPVSVEKLLHAVSGAPCD